MKGSASVVSPLGKPVTPTDQQDRFIPEQITKPTTLSLLIPIPVHYESDDETKESEVECEPTTFEDALNHPDTNNKKGWREAIKKEFSDMKSRKSWQKVKKFSQKKMKT
jgi:hypothetical protein